MVHTILKLANSMFSNNNHITEKLLCEAKRVANLYHHPACITVFSLVGGNGCRYIHGMPWCGIVSTLNIVKDNSKELFCKTEWNGEKNLYQTLLTYDIREKNP